MERLIPAVVAPQKKAVIPDLDCLVSIEQAIASGCDKSGQPLPMVLKGMLVLLRVMVGTSARWSDVQHTGPSSHFRTASTIEFTPWRTKTVKKKDRSKKPVALIAPLMSFSPDSTPW